MNQDYLHDIEAVGARTCLAFRLRVCCLFVDTNLERAIEGHQMTCRGDMSGGRRYHLVLDACQHLPKAAAGQHVVGLDAEVIPNVRKYLVGTRQRIPDFTVAKSSKFYNSRKGTPYFSNYIRQGRQSNYIPRYGYVRILPAHCQGKKIVLICRIWKQPPHFFFLLPSWKFHGCTFGTGKEEINSIFSTTHHTYRTDPFP